MSRAMGDLDNKKISEEPDVYFYNKKDFLYVLLGSDGLFDVLQNGEILDLLNRHMDEF